MDGGPFGGLSRQILPVRRSVADPGEEEEIEGGQDFQKIHFKNCKHLSLDFKKMEYLCKTLLALI